MNKKSGVVVLLMGVSLICLCTEIGPETPSGEGPALRFNGTGNYVDISSITAYGSTTISYAVWICPAAMNGDRAVITRGTANLGVSLGVSNSRVWIGGNSGSGWDNAFAHPLTQNTWYHLAAIYDQQERTIKLYVNGNLDTIATGMDFRIDGDNFKTFISRNQSTNVQHFSGIIDNLSIWDRAISEEEIAHCMEGSLKGDEAGLIAYFDFGEGEGTSTFDLSSSHYEGVFGDTGTNELPVWITVDGNN